MPCGRMYHGEMTKATNRFQPLDDRDRRILALVQRDAKLPQAEIARRVGLSAAAVNERLKKLESAGVIRRFTALVDARALGVPILGTVPRVEGWRRPGSFLQRNWAMLSIGLVVSEYSTARTMNGPRTIKNPTADLRMKKR